jgi:cell division protein FtsL
MSEAFEYEIRKDVRNNPIVREVDETRHRELWKSVSIVLLLVAALMFAGWSRTGLIQHGYQVHPLEQQLQKADERNRQLKVELEQLSAPHRIEKYATEHLKLVPGHKGAVILERVVPAEQPVAPPSGAVVARR